MIRSLIVAIFLLISAFTFSQGCFTPIDTIETNQCEFVSQNPPIPAGIAVTRCFTIIPETQFVSFGFLFIQSPSCGPIAYSYLNYQLFDHDCGSLLFSGQIFPIPTNTNITITTYPDTLNLCLTWMPLCQQTSVCPSYSFSPLPIELIYFRGSRLIDHALLEWASATEINSEKYVLERSTDFENWELIATVPSAGNSLTERYYSYKDQNLRTGTNYYRLFQYGRDGSSELLKVTSVFFDGKTEQNPFLLYNVLGQRIK